MYQRLPFVFVRIAHKKLKVQMGKLRECVQLVCYLSANPLVSFAESGSCIHPERPTWSASPDGKVTDIGPFELPEPTLLHYATLDRTCGVVEFKASRNNFDMTATHVEQCVWEMLCCNVMWCDLVRYSEQWERDDRNVFRPATKCKVIRIFRSKELEDEFIPLVIASLAVRKNNAAFVQLVHTAPFVTLRAKVSNAQKFLCANFNLREYNSGAGHQKEISRGLICAD